VRRCLVTGSLDGKGPPVYLKEAVFPTGPGKPGRQGREGTPGGIRGLARGSRIRDASTLKDAQDRKTGRLPAELRTRLLKDDNGT
jgi:hypothetical protein